jgi:LuxR family transcriptional regulator, maltose regulon positive regulatory protein
VPLVCVVAPAGYGKTTLLTQWGRSKGDRVGWVSLDARDNDPVVLLTYLAVALDRIEPVEPGVFRALASPGASVLTAAVPRLASAVAAMSEPVALVLDQVESLDDQRCLDAVAELALALPAGSQLALAARRPPALPVALLRAGGRVVEIGAAELAMDDQEANALLEKAGVGPSSPEVPELVKRAEGWPVGLYLAALALQAGGSWASAGAGFSGEDRFMADYLRSELLAQLPTERVEFLTRTAVLERMCGPLCDAVLAGTGSGAVLGAMEDANLLLVPLDRRRRWYRYHQLLRELLLAELERREPELIPQLHTRAAAWYEANDQPEAAIDHAKAAGDPDQVARLVSEAAPRAYASGRRDTAIWWYDWFEDQGLMERYPVIAIQGPCGICCSASRRGPSAGRRRPNARRRRWGPRTAGSWRCCWPCSTPACAATASSGCAPTRGSPGSGSSRETRWEGRRSTSRGPPTSWPATSTVPMGCWPGRSRSPPRIAR